MKNKEIEELLNKLRNTADTSFFAVCGSKEELDKMPKSVCKFLSLNNKQAKLLLSYIEQLEKEIEEYQKELEKADSITQSCIFNGKKDSEISYRKCLNLLKKYKENIEQLENNRDKAIEFIEIELSQGGERELRDLVDGYEVLKLLKGDSDD